MFKFVFNEIILMFKKSKKNFSSKLKSINFFLSKNILDKKLKLIKKINYFFN